MKDNLNRRERLVYKALHGLGVVIAAIGLFWFVILDRDAPTYAIAVVFSLACLLVPVFGLALRSDTRVIHGIAWLRPERGPAPSPPAPANTAPAPAPPRAE